MLKVETSQGTEFAISTLRQTLDDIAYNYSKGDKATVACLQDVSEAWLLFWPKLSHLPQMRQKIKDRMDLVRGYAVSQGAEQ